MFYFLINCGIIGEALDGASPSGKAVGSGPTIRGFESLRSSQENKIESLLSYFVFLRAVRDHL